MYRISLKILLSSIGIVIILALMCTATYAYFTLDIEGSGNTISMTTFNKNMQVTYTDTSNVTMVNAYTGSSISKTFTVENTGDTDVYYNVILEDVVNNFEVPEELIYNIVETGGSAFKNNTVIPTSDEVILSDIKIAKGETHYYVMKITFLEKTYNQSYNMNKTFSSKINILPSKKFSEFTKLSNNTLSYKIINSSVNSSNNLKYNTTGGEGLYFTNNAINGTKIYFYRGSNTLKNNVSFGGFCWKIVRTTEDIGVRLIYNGVLNNGECSNATGTNSIIDSTAFNDSSNYNAYVGYMYGSPNSTNYIDEHKNANNSKIKTLIESWYANNLINYGTYIDDSIYCNDRKSVAFTINGVTYSKSGYGNLNTGYQSKMNININSIPFYECYNEKDKFTVKNSNNIYPIGLLTAEEAMFAGLNENSSLTNNYLYSANTYWTMSPAYYNGTYAYNYVVQNGKLNTVTTNASAGVRPVITLKGDVKVLSGDGSLTSPYKITE